MVSPFLRKTFFSFLLLSSLVFSFTTSLAQEDKSDSECNGPFKGRERPLQKKEIEPVLKQHFLWLNTLSKKNKTEGKRASFKCANLQGAGLSFANLTEANLRGANLEEANLSKAKLGYADLTGANLRGANLRGASLKGANLSKVKLDYADLTGADLALADLMEANLIDANLSHTRLQEADLTGANALRVNLMEADLEDANLPHARLHAADLTGAFLVGANLEGTNLIEANLTNVNLKSAILPKREYDGGLSFNKLHGANFKGANISGVDLEELEFALKPGGIPLIPSFAQTKNLEKLAYVNPPHSLVEIRNGLKEAGMREQERILTYVIKHGEMEHGWAKGEIGISEYLFSYILFELTCDWGMSPGRPLRIMGFLFLAFSLIYMLALNYRFALLTGGSGAIVAIWFTGKNEERERVTKEFFFPQLQKKSANKWWGSPIKWACVPLIGLYFSLLATFHIGWRDLNLGSWITRIQAREYVLRATGWVRVISGVQSLISVYLLALWALTYFGRPFE